jgi:phosphate:Na+ symporter
MANPFAEYDLWAGLFGGLALFLFGMDIMTQALKTTAGDYMKDILGKLTRNRFVGVGMGAMVTAVIQSSSVTTVLLVGFISAGLMSMSQSVAVIMGANIGTTITAQILAFKVTKLALPIIAVGFTIAFTATRNNWRQYGLILLGLGMIFYGMSVMSGALSPLRSFDPFIRFMTSLQNPMLAAGVGMIFTAVVQSSSATTGILIVMASQGLIELHTAIAMALGANVGTCITAGLAAIGKPREALRAAAVHTFFNVAGVLIWIAFIPQLANLAMLISPAHEHLSGTARLAAETPRQIANIHTFFNVVNVFLFIPFTTQIAHLVNWMIPDKPIRPDAAMLPKYLDKSVLSTPAIALEAARLEIRRLGKRVRAMFSAIMPAAITGSRNILGKVRAMDKAVDALHLAIIEYLGEISLSRLSKRQSEELMQLVETANDLEHVGDRVATDMVRSALKAMDEGVRVSEQTARVLEDYHANVSSALDDALKAVAKQNPKLAKQVKRGKQEMTEQSRTIAEHALYRLTADAPNRLNTYAREMEFVEILDGIYKIARRIARTQLKLARKES